VIKLVEESQAFSVPLIETAYIDVIKKEVWRLVEAGYDIIEIKGIRFVDDEDEQG
jgi:hypothetical protein